MRTKGAIWADLNKRFKNSQGLEVYEISLMQTQLEVLLDIRDLLSQEKLEKQYPYIGPAIEGEGGGNGPVNYQP